MMHLCCRIDEAAGLKESIEEYVLRVLVPMGVRLVVTSRPEGVRLELYEKGWVVMNLMPLTGVRPLCPRPLIAARISCV